jgi:multidrug efflux pump subunit AcrA (membrane-fusion protein)
MTRVVLVGMGAALLAFGLGTLIGVRLASRDAGGAPVAVATHAPTTAPVAPAAPRDGFTGVVFSKQQVDLASTIDARVIDVPVELGDRLKKGDVVAHLDADSIRRELASATAAVRAAQAEVSAAKVEEAEANDKAARMDKLGDAVSAEERECAHYRAKTASAHLAAALYGCASPCPRIAPATSP